MSNKYISIIIIGFITFFGCKSKKIDSKDHIEIVFTAEKVTKELYSPDKSHLLILDYQQNKNAILFFSYRVINTETKNELISGTFSGVKMEWINNNSIKGYKYVGMIEKKDDRVVKDNKPIESQYIIIKIDTSNFNKK